MGPRPKPATRIARNGNVIQLHIWVQLNADDDLPEIITSNQGNGTLSISYQQPPVDYRQPHALRCIKVEITRQFQNVRVQESRGPLQMSPLNFKINHAQQPC